MDLYLGIDLGSTTSKAIILDGEEGIIGRGITNTRANYEVAAQLARMEAEFNSRFTLLYRRLKSKGNGGLDWETIFPQLENRFQYLQFKSRFDLLMETMAKGAGRVPAEDLRRRIIPVLDKLEKRLQPELETKYLNGQVATRSEFFRDLFGTAFLHALQEVERDLFDPLIGLYDRSITPVENQVIDFDFAGLAEGALKLLPEQLPAAAITPHLEAVTAIHLKPKDYIGTGYGRQLLPFEENHLKSEILCHALGAHACFPGTRTVLDIGGQDTKAIQVDSEGLVTSFQMNDRCAAGCGRYLGYIADEMNLGVGELGPLALQADYEANICSTCTVFAGAELREYLNLGEKQENILAGLHQAIVQRAFALLARSGGVRNEFTFTGGVARNPAVVKYVRQLVQRHYGELTINEHPDSIFMGALGAALFSSRR